MPSARGEGGGAEEAPLLPASSSSSGAAVVLKATSGAVAAPRSPDADIEAKKSVLRLRWLLGVAYMMVSAAVLCWFCLCDVCPSIRRRALLLDKR